MPIDDSTWNQATEQDSTATQLVEFLQDNESAAYTTNELVSATVPEDSVDESVLAYYRAVLELLVRDGTISKCDVRDDDAENTGLVPYFRASAEADEQAKAPPTEQPTEQSPTTREVPLRVRMAEDSDAIPVRIEGGGQLDTDSNAPFFVRWYRWYKKAWQRAARKRRRER
ncbi:MAG TPA: hypothetical protein VFJ06_14530 [Halococcus sp.]|nr:hypothetical protein [Halococcus sp.]